MGVFDKEVSKKYISNGTKKLVFFEMHHVGKQEFYDDVKHDLDSLLGEGYKLFFEGVGLDKSIDSLTKDTLFRKVRKITGMDMNALSKNNGYLDTVNNKLAGKKTSYLAKAAAAVSVYKGSSKANWYAKTNEKYENALSAQGLKAEKLVVPVDIAGKEAMVEEMLGLGFAAGTAEVNRPLVRFALGALAFGHVAVSWRRSQIVARHYAEQAEQMISQVESGEISGQDDFKFDPMPVTPIFSRQRSTTPLPDSLAA